MRLTLRSVHHAHHPSVDLAPRALDLGRPRGTGNLAERGEVQEDDLTVPARYRGIGVRIEDDVLVTARGMKNLSADIPSEAGAVERWMASLRKRPAARRR